MAAPFIHELEAELAEKDGVIELIDQRMVELEIENCRLAEQLFEARVEIDRLATEVSNLATEVAEQRVALDHSQEMLKYWMERSLPLPQWQNQQPAQAPAQEAWQQQGLQSSPAPQSPTTWIQAGPHSQQQS